MEGRDPLVADRSYRSLVAGEEGWFGDGWRSRYEMALLAATPAAGEVTIVEENGAEILFEQTPVGLWAPANPRTQARLTYSSSQDEWTFTRNRQEIFVFDGDGKLMRIMSLDNAEAGVATTIDYPSADEVTVTEPSGRQLTYQFDSTHPDRVASVTDSTGRASTFEYDSSGAFLVATTDARGQGTSYCYNVESALSGCPGYDAGQATNVLTRFTDPRGHEVVNNYDTDGRVLQQLDREGNSTTFDYGASTDPACQAAGSLSTTEITFPNGSDGQPDFRLDTYRDGVLVCQTSTGANTVPETWHISPDPVTLEPHAVTDPNGHVTRTWFDAWGNPTEMIDPLGRRTVASYNRFNMPREIVDPSGVATTFEHAESHAWLVEAVSRPLLGTSDVATTQLGYDVSSTERFGDLVDVIDPENQTWSYAYDDAGNLVASEDPLGNKSTFGVDMIGRRTNVLPPNGNAGGGNPGYRVASMLDPIGHSQAQVHAPGGLIVDSFGREASDSSLGEADTGETWSSVEGTWGVRGASGVLTAGTAGQAVVDAGTTGAIAFSMVEPREGDGVVFRHSDESNYWKAIADPSNDRWRLEEVSAGSVTQSIASDIGTCCEANDVMLAIFIGPWVGLRSLEGEALILGEDSTHTTASGAGLFSAQPAPAGAAGVTGWTFLDLQDEADNRVALRTFDANGNVSVATNYTGDTTHFAYDAEDRPSVVTRPDQSTLETLWWDNGLLAAQIDSAGAVTSYAYDHARRLVAGADPAERVTAYDYDAAGNVVRVRTPEYPSMCDPAATLTYDAANQLTTAAFGSFTGGNCDENYTPDADAPDVDFVYDSLGRRVQMTDGSGVSCYEWDSLGRLVELISRADSCEEPGVDTATIGYDYDLVGRPTQLWYPEAPAPLTRGYDAAGRMTSSVDWEGNTAWWGYDANSQVVCHALAETNVCDTPGASAFEMAYRHNTAGELTDVGSDAAILIEADGGVAAEFSYSRDNDGYVTSEVATVGSDVVVDDIYTYDPLDRIASVDSASYGYDTAGNIDRLIGGIDLSYDNDPAEVCPPTCTGAANQPLERLQGTDLLNTYSYDANGRRVTDQPEVGDSVVYGWNKTDQLVEIGDVSYGYDGDGLRVSQQAPLPGSELDLSFVWDPVAPLPVALHLGVADSDVWYLYGPDGAPYGEISQFGTDPPESLFYGRDQIGSARLVLDDTGEVVGELDFDPYGRLTRIDGDRLPTGIGFTGEWMDTFASEDHMLYLRARWYDADTAQFMSRDPLGLITRTPYAYGDNNPLMHTDPTGMAIPVVLGLMGVGAAAGAMSGVADSVAAGDLRFTDGGLEMEWESVRNRVIFGAFAGAAGGAVMGTAPMMAPFISSFVYAGGMPAVLGEPINLCEVGVSTLVGGAFGNVAARMPGNREWNLRHNVGKSLERYSAEIWWELISFQASEIPHH